MNRFSCGSIPTWLAAHHDGELTLEEQIAVEGHISTCPACAGARDDLKAIRSALRLGAAVQHAESEDVELFAVYTATALSQVRADLALDWSGRLRRAIEDAPRFWIAGASASVTTACALLLVGVLSLATPLHPESFSAVLQALEATTAPSSSIQVAPSVILPYVPPDSQVSAIFYHAAPAPPRSSIPVGAFVTAQVVTREGRIAFVRVENTFEGDDELRRDVSRLASDVRFAPARYGASEVQDHVVWLFETTTVLGDAGVL